MLILFWPNGPRKWQKKLAGQLGIPMSIQRVHTPLPSTTILENSSVQLSQERKWNLERIKMIQSGQTCHFLVEAESIDASDMVMLLQKVIQRQISLTESKTASSRVELDQLVVTAKLNGHQKLRIPLREIKITTHSNSVQWQAGCEFKIGDSKANPIHFTLSFDREKNNLCAFTLDTGQEQVPVALLHAWLPMTRRLGPNASFQGVIDGRQTNHIQKSGHSWSGRLKGEICQVDLYDLIDKSIGLVCSGTAKLAELDCQIKDNRIISLKSTLECKEGVFDASIVRAIGKWDHLRVPRDIRSSQTFKNFRARLEIENSRIHVWSANPSSPQHVIAFDSRSNPLIEQIANSQGKTLAFALRIFQPKAQRDEIPMTAEAISVLDIFAR